MPIRIDKKLPAVEILRTENIFVMDDQRAAHQAVAISTLGRSPSEAVLAILT